MGKRKAIAKVILTIHYDLDGVEIEALQDGLKGTIGHLNWYVDTNNGEAAHAIKWDCEVSVCEVSKSDGSTSR